MEQACKLVNRPSFQELADEKERVRDLYQRVYQRDPSAKEIERGIRFIEATSASTSTEEPNTKKPLTPLERFAQVLLMSNELMFVD